MTYPVSGNWQQNMHRQNSGNYPLLQQSSFVCSATSDLVPTHAGVRAQTLMNDGKLVDDFFNCRK